MERNPPELEFVSESHGADVEGSVKPTCEFN